MGQSSDTILDLNSQPTPNRIYETLNVLKTLRAFVFRIAINITYIGIILNKL